MYMWSLQQGRQVSSILACEYNLCEPSSLIIPGAGPLAGALEVDGAVERVGGALEAAEHGRRV